MTLLLIAPVLIGFLALLIIEHRLSKLQQSAKEIRLATLNAAENIATLLEVIDRRMPPRP